MIMSAPFMQELERKGRMPDATAHGAIVKQPQQSDRMPVVAQGDQGMAELPRLNSVTGALEKGQHALVTFSPADVESAIALATAKYDGVFYEMEHNAYDIRAFRDCLQYMLNRAQIAKSGSIAPAVTPHVRIPPNGGEKAQFHAKQVLDLGAYGIIWPHISNVEQAYNAVAACRYPRLKNKPLYEPAGIRGDGPTQAVRYWGVTQQEYYERADVWPLNPKGEIFVILMIEDTEGINNLKDILKNVPGIGAILIGEGDLSQELGYPRQYEHKVVLDAMAQIVATCKEAGVVVGHPHVETHNVERIVKEGYRFLMCAPVRSYGNLDAARKFAGRA
jgi:4-hydroxy-2-oxoheptanedioate aldolase